MIVGKDVDWTGFELRRARMVTRLRQMGIPREEILQAMASVPRHVFVEEA